MGTRTTDGGLDELGALITAAFDLDNSWRDRSRCFDYPKPTEAHPTPWQYSPGQVRVDYVIRKGKNGQPFPEKRVIKGEEMVKVALMVCGTCPAQYDCARWAVQARVRGATYSMPIRDMLWLQGQEDWGVVLDAAENLDVSVQVAVRERRAARTTPDRVSFMESPVQSYRGTVVASPGTSQEEETLRDAAITILGSKAKLSFKDDPMGRFREFDVLDEYDLVSDVGGGESGRPRVVVFTGTSAFLRDEVKTGDAKATWTLYPSGCESC